MTADIPTNNQADIQNAPPEEGTIIDIKTKSIFNKEIINGVPVEHERWSDRFVPFEYKLTKDGVVKINDGERASNCLFAGPIIVVATTANPLGGDGGLVLEFQNKRNKYITISIPRARIHEEPRLLAQDLASQNFEILPGKEKELLLYLAKCKSIEERISCIQTGWAHSNDPEKLVFVQPGSSTEAGYIFQPERHGQSTHSVRPSGTLNEWINNVFNPDPFPLLSIFGALAAPLLKFASTGTMGIHFWGGSSSGKTTLAQIAASVFGCGADPSEAASNPYIGRWNTTLNALEAIASSRNDMPMIMDELGSVDGRNYQRMIYDLSGGHGKAAMTANRQMRDLRTWLTFIMSTGEISSLSKLEENLYGKKMHAKAGALIRLIDIAIKQGIFNDRTQVDRTKRACALYYGTLGPAFIDRLCQDFTANTLRNNVQELLDSSLQHLTEGRGTLNAVQERGLKPFALMRTAGLMLVHFKLIPTLSTDLVDHTIDSIVDEWMPSSVGLSDTERAITSLREFILKYRDARFKNLKEYISSLASSQDDKFNREIAGYYDPIRDAFFMLPEAFREASGGEPKVTATALRQQGYLLTDRPDRLMARLNIEGRQVGVYGIKSSLLGEDST